MTKSLIIAEKPSVALDISRALGGFTRHGDYFESDHYVLAASVGHLLSLVAPNDPVRGKWTFTHLPVIPDQFELGPINKKSNERLKLLVKLIKRKDVTAIINACDAGREGELIFRYIVQYAKTNKPVKRLWLRSMTQTAIREAFETLRDDETMQPLADAARSRAEADWLIGINGTRAMTAFNSKSGGFFKTPVGRVQTPTLSIVAKREEEIRRFIPQDYWEVHATFEAAAGHYDGRWYDPAFKKDADNPHHRNFRIWSKEQAEQIVAACENQAGEVTEESKPSKQLSPGLFDLTTLQREANSRFGFSAKTTLALAQTLYERHKALTYPRTDSRFLPEDYLATVKQTVRTLAESDQATAASVKPFAQMAQDNHWIKPNRRIFNNAKVSDHFAIIPTLQCPKNLSDAEFKIYELVTRRFLAVFFPAAEYKVTTRITTIGDAHFRTEGRVLVKPGWLAIYGREAQGAADTLVPVQDQEIVQTDTIELRALATKPPARFTEATLLSAMESAGKLVDDEALRDAMSERGLGTPATRAAIIEGLLTDGYLRREGRELVPSAKTRQLMTLLSGLGVNELTSPELTGEWEHKLANIEQRQLDRKAFMKDIAEMTEVIVRRAKEYDGDTVPGDYATLETPCPNCAGVVKETYRRYACTQCDFSISKYPGGRTFETHEVETLLQDKELGPLTGFISRMGRPFAAILRITDEHKLEFDFGQKDDEKDNEPVDFSQKTALGKCPKCKHSVYEHGMNYVCEKSVGPDKTCDFRTGKVILQQDISPEQVTKLLSEGKTDLLPDFVSNRTHRKFKAYLVLQKSGKVGFEFQPRASKKSAKKAAKKATKKVAKKARAKKATAKKSAAKKTSKAS